MQQKKILLLGILLIFSLTTFGQNTKAAKYNNKIIDQQHQVAETMADFLKGFKTDSKEELESKRSKLLSSINASISKIEKMEGFEGDNQLKQGALELLNFYKGTVEKDYAEIVKLVSNKNKSETDKSRLELMAKNLISKEEEMDKKFEGIQQEFAKKHNLEVKTYPLN